MNKLRQFLAALVFFVLGLLAAMVGPVVDNSLFIAFVAALLIYVISLPLLKWFGLYIHLSEMLVMSVPCSNYCKLHDGTVIDFMLLRRKYRSSNLRLVILKEYLVGLLNIIRRIERGEISENIQIEASTYLFSERTVRKFLFEQKQVRLIDWVSFVVNYPVLFLMKSLAYRKIKFPDLRTAITIHIHGKDLLSRKELISLLYHKIERKI